MVQTTQTGLMLQLTPKFAPGGSGMRIATYFESREMNGTVQQAVAVAVPGAMFPVTKFVEMPRFDTQSMRAEADLREGETMVFASSSGGTSSFTGAIRESLNPGPVTIVIVTPHIVKSQDDVGRVLSEVQKSLK